MHGIFCYHSILRRGSNDAEFVKHSSQGYEPPFRPASQQTSRRLPVLRLLRTPPLVPTRRCPWSCCQEEVAQALCGYKLRVLRATRKQHKPDSKARRQSKLCKQSTQPPNLCFTSESEEWSTLLDIVSWIGSLACHSTDDLQQPL